MTAGEQQATDLKQVLRLARQGMQPGAGDWLAPLRERAAAEVLDMPMPERKLEAWRYTPVSFLDRAGYTPAPGGAGAALQPADLDTVLLPDHRGHRLVFVNGHYAPALSETPDAADGLVLATLSGALGEIPAGLREQLDRIAEHRHVFAALNSALMSDGALIHVAQGASAGMPIEILHVSVAADQPPIVHPRHLIVLDAGARAQVIERYCSLGEGVYFNNAMIEIALGADSQLVHERVQEESANAQHLSDLHVRLGARSRYRQVLAALGGAWSRDDQKVVFAGEGARAEFDGLMLARDRQLNDVHLDVRHEVPDCTSVENFKGILDGNGRVVFDGRIVVARDAQKTDAMLSNHNLMLSRSAEVDTKPQLEIYADDVKCSHGTTVGELDHNMLFYLRSRGIPERQARQMLSQGFAQEVLLRIDTPALRARAERLLAARLLESV